jgi:hypothetical protein
MAKTSKGKAILRVPEKRQTSLPWHTSSLIVVITACITWTFASMIHSIPTKADPCETAIGCSLLHRLTASKKDRSKEQAIAVVSERYTGPSRVFPKFEHPFPCYKGEPLLMRETPAAEGILFQRPHKTGSTTMVGIVLRLVHNRAKIHLEGGEFDKCKHRAMHGVAKQYQYGQRDRTKSFLFSIIRDPTARMISQFFHFDVTGYQKEPTDHNFLSMARGLHFNYYLSELSTRHYVPNGTVISDLDFAKSVGFETERDLRSAMRSPKPGPTQLLRRQRLASNEFGLKYDPNKIVQDILDDYDFIAIMERMDESLVVFQMLLGLTTKEILYTRARSSGTFSNGWHGRPCIFIMKSFLTPDMKAYFESEEWKLTVANDILMYQAANKSLDRTIASLDPVEFQKNMAALRRGLKLAAESCKGKVRPICTDGGVEIPAPNRTCYIWSEGCDHHCIDEVEF